MLMVCAVERSAMWLNAKGNADVVCALTSKRLISKRARQPWPLVYVAHKSLLTELRHRLLGYHRPHLHWLSYAKCHAVCVAPCSSDAYRLTILPRLNSLTGGCSSGSKRCVISIETKSYYWLPQTTITHAKERPTNDDEPIKQIGS